MPMEILNRIAARVVLRRMIGRHGQILFEIERMLPK